MHVAVCHHTPPYNLPPPLPRASPNTDSPQNSHPRCCCLCVPHREIHRPPIHGKVTRISQHSSFTRVASRHIWLLLSPTPFGDALTGVASLAFPTACGTSRFHHSSYINQTIENLQMTRKTFKPAVGTTMCSSANALAQASHSPPPPRMLVALHTRYSNPPPPAENPTEICCWQPAGAIVRLVQHPPTRTCAF